MSCVLRDEELVDEVLVLHRRGRLAAAAAALRLVFGDRLRLGIAAVRQRDDDVLLLDQVFDREIRVILDDLGAARVAVLLADVFELGANHLQQPLGAREDVGRDRGSAPAAPGTRRRSCPARAPSGDAGACRGWPGPASRTGDSRRPAARTRRPGRRAASTTSPARASICRHGARRSTSRAISATFASGGRRRRLDERDDLVDVGERDRQAFEDVRALACLAQIVDRAARDDFAAVAQEGLEHLLEVEQLRLAVDAARPC